MNLIIIRHAVAEDRAVWAELGKDDADRPLTKKGKKRMQRAVEGLATALTGIDVLGTSPFSRARQTASIVGREFGVKPKRVDALTPTGRREDVLEWLRDQPEEQTITIVGHEPSLGLLASWLLAAPMNHFLEFKKGGAAKLTWPGPPEPGMGWLRWMLTPSQLRSLAP